MTTPTTASLHREMVEALRKLSKTYVSDVGERCIRCLNHHDACHCDGHTARAALEGWEKRPRLRDDEALVRELRFDLPDRDTTLRVLDSVERALYGERG